MKPMMQNQTVSYAEKRAYARVPFTRKIMVLDIGNGQKFWGNGIDISLMGIGFYSKKFLQKDRRASVQVWLDNDNKVDPVWMSGIVKWAKLEQNGAVMGIQFDTIIRAAEHPALYEQIYKKDF